MNHVFEEIGYDVQAFEMELDVGKFPPYLCISTTLASSQQTMTPLRGSPFQVLICDSNNAVHTHVNKMISKANGQPYHRSATHSEMPSFPCLEAPKEVYSQVQT